jgi:hypothetical protein
MLPLSFFKSTPKSNIKVTIENKGNWQKQKKVGSLLMILN